MTTTHRLLSLVASLTLAACAVDGDPENPTLEDEPTATTVCGEGTLVASLISPTRSTVDFCLYGDGLHGVRETGALDVESYLDRLSPLLCADQIHAELAPGQPVPQPLVDACRDSTATPLELALEPGGVADESADGQLNDRPIPLSHYCGGDGYDEFEEERCTGIIAHAEGYSWYDSLWWCTPTLYNWTQLTATSQIGHKVNKLRAQVASCGESTDVKLKAKVAGSWHVYEHGMVQPNYWSSYAIVTNTSLTDYDMRFVAESDSGHFRSTGYFGDYLGP